MAQAEMSTIVANVGVQVINIIIFFGILWYFFGKKIKQWLQEKRELLDKLDNAEAAYQEIIDEANSEKQKMLDDVLQHKKTILEETKISSAQRDQEMLEKTERKIETLLHDAKKQADTMKTNLEESFMDGVKRATHVVVQKLIGKDVKLQEKYLDTLVKEFE